MIKKLINAVILFIFNTSLFACAGGYFDESYKEFIFLHERDLPFSNIVEDLNSSATYNDLIYKYQEKAKKANIKEWKKELNNKFNEEEIYNIVYKRKNLEKLKNQEIKDYIDFVAKQEIHVSRNYYSKKELENAIPVDKLLTMAFKKISTVKSTWLKQRYFYLVFRLAHYKKLNIALKIYKTYKHLLNTENKTIVKDWIQGLYAGALIKNGQVEKGVYEFTKLFDEKRINWHLAYYNFHHIQSDKQWENLISLAKNDDEKINFFVLRALNKNSNLEEELKNIENININSKWFDILLFRQLLYSQHFFDKYDKYSEDESSTPYFSKNLISYLKNINKKNMYLINLILAYNELYKGNLSNALKYSKKAKQSQINKHEIDTLNYVIYLNSINKIDLKVENEIYERMNSLLNKSCTNNSIHNYTFVKLIDIYKKNNKPFKSYLSSQINYLSTEDLNLKNYNKLMTFFKTDKKSKLEKYISKKIKTNSYDKNIDDFKYTHSKLLINNLKFKEALEQKSHILNEKILFNPFNANIRGNNRTGKKNTYTVKDFLEKTLEVKEQLKKNPNSIIDNYLYANVLYNLSYFGNSNKLTTVYRSNYSFKNKALEEKKINLSTRHYKKALKYAKKKEFKAKLVYLLAKNELALYDLKYSKELDYKSYSYYQYKIYNYERNTSWRDESIKIFENYLKNGYGKYFQELKNSYEDTDYYKDLIKECGNLKLYQNSKS